VDGRKKQVNQTNPSVGAVHKKRARCRKQGSPTGYPSPPLKLNGPDRCSDPDISKFGRGLRASLPSQHLQGGSRQGGKKGTRLTSARPRGVSKGLRCSKITIRLTGGVARTKKKGGRGGKQKDPPGTIRGGGQNRTEGKKRFSGNVKCLIALTTFTAK